MEVICNPFLDKRYATSDYLFESKYKGLQEFRNENYSEQQQQYLNNLLIRYFLSLPELRTKDYYLAPMLYLTVIQIPFQRGMALLRKIWRASSGMAF